MARRGDVRAAGEPVTGAYVSYLRVSTDAQGASGLGLEAQRDAIDRHVRAAGGKVVAEYVEVESGKRDDRPEIAAAIAACRSRRATLIIAKLDRLARNLHFVTGLMQSGVHFLACDNPNANNLMIHMLVAFAQHEREQGSDRTKRALASAKARGVPLGNPRLREGDRTACNAARRAKRRIADGTAKRILPAIEAARKAGCYTLMDLAAALTARGIKTPGGCPSWGAEQVRRLLRRIERMPIG